MYWTGCYGIFRRNNLSFSVLNDYHPPNYWPTPAKKLPRAKEHYWKYITERIKQFVSNGMKTLVLRDNRDTRPTNYPFKMCGSNIILHPFHSDSLLVAGKYESYHLFDWKVAIPSMKEESNYRRRRQFATAATAPRIFGIFFTTINI